MYAKRERRIFYIHSPQCTLAIPTVCVYVCMHTISFKCSQATDTYSQAQPEGLVVSGKADFSSWMKISQTTRANSTGIGICLHSELQHFVWNREIGFSQRFFPEMFSGNMQILRLKNIGQNLSEKTIKSELFANLKIFSDNLKVRNLYP